MRLNVCVCTQYLRLRLRSDLILITDHGQMLKPFHLFDLTWNGILIVSCYRLHLFIHFVCILVGLGKTEQW